MRRKQQTWRDKARAHILAQAAAYRTAGGVAVSLEVHLRTQYPFGVRKHYPYKIWCEEVEHFLHSVEGDDTAVEQALLQAWNSGAPIRSSSELRQLWREEADDA